MKKFYFLFFCLFVTQTAFSQVIWSESFETGDLNGWTSVDADGDGLGWDNSGNIGAFLAADGDLCATSASWTATTGPVTPNNYLISPAIDLIDASGTILIDWQAYGQDQTWANEKYRVVAATEGTQEAIDAGTVLYDGIVGSSGGVYVKETGNLSDFAGGLVHIAFIHYDVTDQFYLNIDAIEIYTSNTTDASVVGVLSPNNASACELSDSETVTISITNNGGSDISNFDVSYSINGGDPVTETVTETITPASNYEYSFATTADLAALGEYTIEASVALADDGVADNNTASSSIRSSDSKITVHVMSDVSGGHAWTITDNSSGEVIAERGAYQWEIEVFDDVCVYSDRCYTFAYTGEMGPGAFLEILLDGTPIAGDTNGAGIPAEVEYTAIGGGCAANEASATRLTFNTYSLVNTQVPASFEFKNLGAAAISEIAASYTVDGGDAISQTFSGLNVLQGGTATATFDTPVDLDAMVVKNVVVTIETVNGEMDDAANNVAMKSMIAMSEIPNRAYVIEEGTGTWCGWCPRGAVGLETITDFNDDAIGIAVHNSDPMDLGDFDDMTANLAGATGYPFGLANRTTLVDPGPDDLVPSYNEEKLKTSPVSLSGTAVYHTGTKELTVDVNTEIYAALLEGDFKVNVILTEDGVTGTVGYDQVNFYAGGAFGAMGGYENLPDPVPAADMVYDHVARMYMGGFDGDANSFPSDATFEATPSYQYVAALDDAWNPANMHAVAMLIEVSTNQIVNAVSMPISQLTNNNDVVENSNIRVFPNPFVEATNIEIDLAEAQDVTVEVFNSIGQRVAFRDYGQLSGKNTLPFNAQNFENGMYFINIAIDNTVTTKKVVLAR